MILRSLSLGLLVSGFALVVGAADEKKDAKKDEKKVDTAVFDKHYAKLDADSDGKVTADEFAFLPNVYKEAARRASNTQLAAIFAKLDKNKDKSISKEEYRKINEFVTPMETPKKKVDPKKKEEPKKPGEEKKK